MRGSEMEEAATATHTHTGIWLACFFDVVAVGKQHIRQDRLI